MENLTKVCSKCKVEKELGEFNNDKYNKDGLRSYCKRCKALLSKDYYKNNIEKRLEYNRKWNINHPEDRKNYTRNCAKNNSEKIKEKNRNFRDSMPNSFIIHKLKAQGFPSELIDNPEMIEIKRLLIQTKRLLKNDGKYEEV